MSNFFSNLANKASEVTASLSQDHPTAGSVSSSSFSHLKGTGKTGAEPNPLDSLPQPPELKKPTRLLLALAATGAATSNPLISISTPEVAQWWTETGRQWAGSVVRVVQLENGRVPDVVSPEQVHVISQEHFKDMSQDERRTEYRNLVETLVIASIFSPPAAEEPSTKIPVPSQSHEDAKAAILSYTPAARQLTFITLGLLDVPAAEWVPVVEAEQARALFTTLQKVSAHATAEQVEKSRAEASEGWGGKTGHWIATGAGVVIGGIAIGVTGGLAAPAIAALIPGFMTFGLLTTATAPVVLGSVFGLTGAGLAGKRVSERWAGIKEFAFVEVHMGSDKIKEAKDDPKYAVYRSERRSSTASPSDQAKSEDQLAGNSTLKDEANGKPVEPHNLSEKLGEIHLPQEKTMIEKSEKEADGPMEKNLLDLEDAPDASPNLVEDHPVSDRRQSIETDTPMLPEETDAEKTTLRDVSKADRPSSLVATIVVPGLLTQSPTEALMAWQSDIVPTTSFQDGRDVYVLRYETEFMYMTGKAIDAWVMGKLKGYVKKQIIKRTVLNAYFAAVSLPLKVYGIATLGLDNSWMRAQSKARKAGRLLGEVLEKRVQGQRPVVLIGSSVGALTVLHALLYLSERPSSSKSLPQIVDSAYLISLPSAPSKEEWAACRRVTGRRLVNAWNENDLLLAGIVRLHEVVSRAVTLQSGLHPAGLRPIEEPGVEDVDLSKTLEGHMEIQKRMKQILQVLRVDA